MEEKKASPVPVINHKMEYRFDFAMREISNGKTMRRKIWDEKEYICLRDGLLKLHSIDDKWYNWAIAEQDLIADDYIIV